MKNGLQPEEKQVAHQLWRDLKSGKNDAPTRLAIVPTNIRDAILAALVVAMDTRQTAENPFD
jgi:hypothetical protein